MSEEKWNAGPWTTCVELGTSYADDELHGRKCCTVESAEGYVVAMTLADIEELKPESNAHLIASAPAMYEALEATSRLLAEYASGLNDDETADILTKSEAALAQARGEVL